MRHIMLPSYHGTYDTLSLENFAKKSEMAGVLYRKPRLHSTFKRCSVILCHGKLLIFQSTLRAHSGVEIPHIHHERQEVVDLSDTYVYSGLVRQLGALLLHETVN